MLMFPEEAVYGDTWEIERLQLKSLPLLLNSKGIFHRL